MATSKTIFITAAEPSADRLGAALITALKKADPTLHFKGAGGPEMRQAGQEQLVPAEQLAVMGIAEVITSIPRIAGHIRTLARAVREEKPLALITIDAWDFSRRLAQKVRAENAGIPIIQYNPPKAWAWRPGRVQVLKHLYTHALSILPFEVEFFKSHGVPISYVGHPMVTALKPYMPEKDTRTHLTLALLPGSRVSELKAHWPVFLATYRRMKLLIPQLNALLVLTVPEHESICRELSHWGEADAIKIVAGENRFAKVAKCRAALAKSGTSNLELALLGVPSVVAYRMSTLTYLIAKKLVKVPYISLPNLIAGKIVFPEFIQNAVKPETLGRALYPLLHDPASGERVHKSLATIRKAMKTPKPPADMAAEIILQNLK